MTEVPRTLSQNPDDLSDQSRALLKLGKLQMERNAVLLAAKAYIIALDNLAADCMNKEKVAMCVDCENILRQTIEACKGTDNG